MKLWKKILAWSLGIIIGVPFLLAVLGAWTTRDRTASPVPDTTPLSSPDGAKVPMATAPATASTAAKPPARPSLWKYSNSKDEMSGAEIRYAEINSDKKLHFEFPYGGENQPKIILRTKPKGGADVLLQIDKGQFICSPGGGCSVMVKFDEKPQMRFSASAPSDHSTTTLFIEPSSKFVSQIKNSAVTRIEATFYQQGNIVMTFKTDNLVWK